VSSRDHRPYAPCVVGDLEVKGYDYWALGHVHGPSPVGESGSIFYSGCLQGRHFREAGARGGYLVTLEAGRPPVVEERRYASVQWEEIVVDDVGASARLSDLDREVGRRQTRLRQTIPGVALAIRVVLRGATARWAELRDDDQIELMASRWQDDFDLLYVEIDTSETHRPLDLESLRNEPTVLSEAMRLVDSLAAADEGAAALLDRVLPEINRAGAGSDYLGLESLEIEALLRDVAERLHEEKE
jgi:DNA repair exonuclease SbcCD nuclease subunit